MGTCESFHVPPFNAATRPCAYCNHSWAEKKSKYRGTTYYDYYESGHFLQRTGQLNAATGKVTQTWLCPTCLDILKTEIDKPVDFMPTPEETAAATIKLVQSQEEVLTAF